MRECVSIFSEHTNKKGREEEILWVHGKGAYNESEARQEVKLNRVLARQQDAGQKERKQKHTMVDKALAAALGKNMLKEREKE